MEQKLVNFVSFRQASDAALAGTLQSGDVFQIMGKTYRMREGGGFSPLSGTGAHPDLAERPHDGRSTTRATRGNSSYVSVKP